MENFVIFCKSYDQDMLRARRMAESVARHNQDSIPLVISVPQRDLAAFKSCFGDIPCRFVTDEEILQLTRAAFGPAPQLFPVDLTQQLIKLEFWRLGLAANYLWIDSDSYFIRPFSKGEFFADADTPYLIQDDNGELLDFARRLGNRKISEDFTEMAEKFRGWFGRPGPLYAFGPSPLIWSSKVLQHLAEEYLKPQHQTIYQLLEKYPCEMHLYGEYLHHCRLIPIVPHPPLFKVFHYGEQFFESQARGESEHSLSRDYLGLVIQSNWAGMVPPKKPTLVRINREVTKAIRKLLTPLRLRSRGEKR